MFKRKKWKYLILDEAHMIKNWKSQRWQTLLRFNSKRRLLITGALWAQCGSWCMWVALPTCTSSVGRLAAHHRRVQSPSCDWSQHARRP